MPELESLPVPPLAGMLQPYSRRKTLEDLADQSAPKRKAPKGGGFSIFDRMLSRRIRSNAAAPSASAHRPKGPHPGNPKTSSPRWKARERR
jgi:hypothetical protein